MVMEAEWAQSLSSCSDHDKFLLDDHVSLRVDSDQRSLVTVSVPWSAQDLLRK